MAGGSQWRKYIDIGGADARAVGLHMPFLMAARLELAPAEMARVVARTQAIGANVDPARFAAPAQG